MEYHKKNCTYKVNDKIFIFEDETLLHSWFFFYGKPGYIGHGTDAVKQYIEANDEQLT